MLMACGPIQNHLNDKAGRVLHVMELIVYIILINFYNILKRTL